jgi:cobalt-zinc-cadmium efflux system outer membrane protein
LTVPPDLLPGPLPPELRLPRDIKASDYEMKKREALERFFQPLPPLGPDPTPVPGPEGRPLTLSDLQRIGMSESPTLQQAEAAVQAARGAAAQAGLWPNPNLGFEVDTFGTTGGPGYPGAFIDQLIKTGGKLQVARAIATMDLRNAELARRRAQTDLITNIRRGYFQVLVAQENIRISKVLAQFAQRVYETQLQIVRGGGFGAVYEPMYLRALAYQTRGSLVQARNAYVSAWKQLAAAMGVPRMPPTQLAGRVDMPVPVYEFDKVLARVLAQHTDVLTAQTLLQQARLNLQLAKLQPYPDVDLRVLVQRDYTGPPFAVAPSVAVSMPMPIWNRNQGGIYQAQSSLVQMAEEPHRVRSALTSTLTLAFERYRNARVLLDYQQNFILPDLVRFYNSVYQRYRAGEAQPGVGAPGVLLSPAPGFNDIVVAQGNLAAAVTQYVLYLGNLWQSVVDVTDLLQTNDLFGVNGTVTPAACPVPIPDLEKLAPLPCRHPCSPLPGLEQRPPDGTWPPAQPLPTTPQMRPADDEARKSRPQPAAPAAPAAPTLPPVEAAEPRRPERLPDEGK